MALATAGWRVFVTLRDNGGNDTTKTYEMNAADATEAAATVADLITALNAVTDAVIVSYGFYELFVENAFAYPGEGVQIENLAQLNFSLEDRPNVTAVLTIPAPNIGIFVASSGAGANIVDTSDAALIAYRDLFRTGGGLLLSDGEVAESLISGKRIHRKSRRG